MKNIIEKELSYQITGICYNIHNELGRYLTEKQYCDAFATAMKKQNIFFVREPNINTNDELRLNIGRPDFIVDNRIIVDFKAKKFVTKEDYNQMQKYLNLTGKELGMIINFRSSFLKPKRILNLKLYSEHSDAN